MEHYGAFGRAWRAPLTTVYVISDRDNPHRSVLVAIGKNIYIYILQYTYSYTEQYSRSRSMERHHTPSIFMASQAGMKTQAVCPRFKLKDLTQLFTVSRWKMRDEKPLIFYICLRSLFNRHSSRFVNLCDSQHTCSSGFPRRKMLYSFQLL